MLKKRNFLLLLFFIVIFNEENGFTKQGEALAKEEEENLTFQRVIYDAFREKIFFILAEGHLISIRKRNDFLCEYGINGDPKSIDYCAEQDKLFCITSNDNLYIFDEEEGICQEIQIGNSVVELVYDKEQNKIFCGLESGGICCFDDQGDLLWQSRIGDHGWDIPLVVFEENNCFQFHKLNEIIQSNKSLINSIRETLIICNDIITKLYKETNNLYENLGWLRSVARGCETEIRNIQKEIEHLKAEKERVMEWNGADVVLSFATVGLYTIGKGIHQTVVINNISLKIEESESRLHNEKSNLIKIENKKFYAEKKIDQKEKEIDSFRKFILFHEKLEEKINENIKQLEQLEDLRNSFESGVSNR